jgi:hypothetical protein
VNVKIEYDAQKFKGIDENTKFSRKWKDSKKLTVTILLNIIWGEEGLILTGVIFDSFLGNKNKKLAVL